MEVARIVSPVSGRGEIDSAGRFLEYSITSK